jgi:AraC-like DNA-binding protein
LLENGTVNIPTLVPPFVQVRVIGIRADLDRTEVTLLAFVTRAVPAARALPPETPRQALVSRIRAYIESHLGDPQLSPPEVARAHHISLRYLHKLFEPEPHGVAGLIRQRRLERCRDDLLDPMQAGRPVAGIAARRGFSSAAHFSRVFRDAYGLPPAEFRRARGLGAAS